MASPKVIQIKESITELKALLKNVNPVIALRIRMLIELKKSDSGISKRELSDQLGVNHNSIQAWRAKYEKGGLSLLIADGRIGFKPSIITKEVHDAISNKLNDPLNGMRGFKELKIWIDEQFGIDVKYNTLLKYSIRNFNTKSKVARKIHISKDEKAVDTFKKTSVQNANNSVKKR
jgi:transposase